MSVLSLDAARKLPVKLGAAARVQRVGAEQRQPTASRVSARVWQALLSVKVDLALDLRGRLVEDCSRPIDGLIGQDFFRGRIVQIDFKAGRIELLDKVDAGSCCAVVSLKHRHRDIMCVEACINGFHAQKWLRLDTGCDEGLHWVSSALKGHAKTSLQLRAGASQRNVRTTMHAIAIFPDEAGLLGNSRALNRGAM